MLITLNQKEIETMILSGLTDMGIPHDDATINMVAGRSPNGITAEVKLSPAKVVESLPPEATFGSESHAPEVTSTKDEYVGNNPNGVDAMKEEATKGDDGEGALAEAPEPEDDTSLFDK